MVLQPGNDHLDIGSRRTELAAELLRSKPPVVVRGTPGLLLIEKLAQRSFLSGPALYHQHNPFHGQVARRLSQVEHWTCRWMCVSLKNRLTRFIYGLR